MLQDESCMALGIDVNTLLAQAFVFLLAGYETTKSALLATSFLLAKHPECQEKVLQEIENVRNENGGELNYEGVASLHYLNACILEALR